MAPGSRQQTRVIGRLVLLLAGFATITATANPTAVAAAPPAETVANCEPTRSDALGPFYVPGAPVRSSVGSGYLLTGVVRTVGSCEPVAGAQIEFWLANPRGQYDDEHRATVLAGGRGEYSFESNRPPAYGGRPPHIHIRVSTPGYRTVVTQHYPADGQQEALFDLVLVAG